MNFRTEIILKSLSYISSLYQEDPLVIIEVGCMYKEDEGISTYVIADFLSKREYGGQLISIEIESEHIKACKTIINKLNSSLYRFIDLKQGHSLSILKGILPGLEKVHFFLLDGGAHPEVCLEEFDISMKYLADNGLILVDDAHELKPTQNYPLHRPMGKATFIIPFLTFSNYIKNREKYLHANSVPGDDYSIPNNQFINYLSHYDFNKIYGYDFIIVGHYQRMLLVGHKKNVKNLALSVLEKKRNRDLSLALKLKRLLAAIKGLVKAILNLF